MDLNLIRKEKKQEGIFGEIPELSLVTLEHSYPLEDGIDIVGYQSKIPLGTYVCQLGLHRLKGMGQSFATYELMNVPEHTGILFHIGNYNKDSDGCILLGTYADMGMDMIVGSRIAFNIFLRAQKEIDSFTLTIHDSI